MPPDLEARATARVAVVVGVVAAFIAAYARYTSPSLPGVTSTLGFYSFSDQRWYLGMARILAHGEIPGRAAYQYGLGYPALGGLFYRLGFHGDPFGPVDVIAFGATMGLTVMLGARAAALFVREHAILLGVAAAGLLLLGTSTLSVVTIPWNSNLVLALGLLVLVLVTGAAPISSGTAATIGISLGWIFATRYADAVFFGLPVVAALVVRPARERGRLLIVGGLSAAVIVGVVLITQYHAFGNAFTTPYNDHYRRGLGSDQSWSNYRIGWIPSHFWSTFVTGRLGSVRQSGSPILLTFPLLPLAPVGIVLLVRATRERVRFVWITAACASLASALLFLAFIAGGAGDIKFHNERYWATWYPLWCVFVTVAAAAALRYLVRGVRKIDGSGLPAIGGQ